MRSSASGPRKAVRRKWWQNRGGRILWVLPILGGHPIAQGAQPLGIVITHKSDALRLARLYGKPAYYPEGGCGAYLRFSKSTGFSTVAEDKGEGARVASPPLSRYAPISEPESNSLSTTSRPPAGPLQAYY